MMDRTEILSNADMIQWLKVLNDGYAKPDLSPGANGIGTVRETKNFVPFIMAINSRLCESGNIECPDIEQFKDFRTTKKY